MTNLLESYHNQISAIQQEYKQKTEELNRKMRAVQNQMFAPKPAEIAEQAASAAPDKNPFEKMETLLAQILERLPEANQPVATAPVDAKKEVKPLKLQKNESHEM